MKNRWANIRLTYVGERSLGLGLGLGLSSLGGGGVGVGGECGANKLPTTTGVTKTGWARAKS